MEVKTNLQTFTKLLNEWMNKNSEISFDEYYNNPQMENNLL